MMKTMMMMLMIWMAMIMWKMKSTKMMVVTFCSFTIISSMLMSSMKKLTIIPFIVILTIIGGLAILFMYMTTTMPLKKMSKTPTQLIYPSITLFMVTMEMTQETKMMKTKINKINLQDPTMSILNTDNSLPLLVLMVMIILTLIFIIKSCSKINSPIRQKMN